MNLRKILSFAIGPLGVAVFGVLTLPLLTWFFSQADIGRLAMFQLLVAFTVLFCSLGLDQAFVREYHEVENKASLLKISLLPGLLVFFFIIFINVVFNFSISEIFLDTKNPLFDLFLLMAVISSYLMRFSSLVLRMEEQGFIFSLSMILPKILFLFFLGFLYFNVVEKIFDNLLLLQTLSMFIVSIFLVYLKRNIIKEAILESYDFKKFKAMFGYSWPLVFSSLAYWALTAMDKLFIKELSSLDELGIYSVAISFASAAILVQSVFSTVWAPLVYKWVAQNKNLHKIAIVRELLLILIAVVIVVACMFSWLTEYFLPSAYVDVQYLLVICMVQPLLYTLSEVTKVGIGITRKSIFSLFATLLALVFNFIGNYYLIPIYGANGAAIATALSFVVFFIVRTEASIYVWQTIPRAKMYAFILFLVVFCILFSLFGNHISNGLRVCIGLTFIIILTFYWFGKVKSMLIEVKENSCSR